MAENKLKYPAKLSSNNISTYGIVDATEVSGFRQVPKLTDLYALSIPILSQDKTGADAIGQEWFVQETQHYYRLINWANRGKAEGWEERPEQSDDNEFNTNVTINGLTKITDTTESTSTTTGALVVAGGVGIGKRLNVGGALSAGASTLASLIVNGATQLKSTLAVTGNTSLYTVSTSGLATLASLTVNGATQLKSTLAVTGATTLASTLSVSDIVTFAKTLRVTGATTLKSTLGVTGATTLASTLSVTGATTLASTLSVTGATTIAGATKVTNVTDSTSATTGAVVVTGGVGIRKNLNVGGTFTAAATTLAALIVNGTTEIKSTLTVKGATSLSTVSTSGLTTLASLTVNGTTNLKSALAVTGATTLASTLAVTGTITGSSTIQGTRLISTIATGTAPLTVASTTVVTNLNADLLDGTHKTRLFTGLTYTGYTLTGTSMPKISAVIGDTTKEITIQSSNVLRRISVGSNTASLSSYWCKVASITLPNAYADASLLMSVYRAYNAGEGPSLLKVAARTNGSTTSEPAGEVKTLGSIPADTFRLYHSGAGENTTFELWANCGKQYGFWNFAILNDGSRSLLSSGSWSINNFTFNAVQTPTLTKYISSSAIQISGNAASATKLATARNINGTAFDGTKDITTAKWGTARTITLAGAVTGSVSINGSANVTLTAAVNHTHPWSQVTGAPATATRWPTISEVTSKANLVIKLNDGTTEGTNMFTYNATGAKTVNITAASVGAAASSHSHSWDSITGKPSSFTPASHTHAWSQITGAPAYATRWPSWSEVTSKPSTFTPSSHSHNYCSTIKVGSTSYNISGNTISIPAYPSVPTALKCPNSLTIQLNGSSQGAWDGSAAKTINITASSIGAATSGHTHTGYLQLNTTSLQSSSNLTISSSFTAKTFYKSSDKRLKTNIEPVSDKALQEIEKLETKQFDLYDNIEHTGNELKSVGYIADEVEDFEELSKFVRIDKEGLKRLDYESLLVLKCKMLENQLKEQKQKYSELEAKFEDINKKLETIFKHLDV